jgi:hypothetical protein
LQLQVGSVRDETVQIDDLAILPEERMRDRTVTRERLATICFAKLILKPALQSSPSTVPISVSTPFFQRKPCTAESGVAA